MTKKFKTTYNYYDCINRGHCSEETLFKRAHEALDRMMNKKLSSLYFKKEKIVAISMTSHLRVEA